MRLKRTAIIIIALTALCAAAAAQAANSSLSFKDKAEVKSRRISLLDIVSNASELDQSIKAKLHKVFVCSAPVRGGSRIISGKQLRGLLKRAGLPGGITTLLPAEVVIHRAVQIVDAAELAQAYRDAVMLRMGRSGNDVDIHSIKATANSTVPAGELELKVHFLGDRLMGRVPALVDIIVDGSKERHIRITGVIDVYGPVVVATRTMSRRHVISDDDVELRRINLSDAPRGVVSEPERVVGMRTRGSISAGEPVDLGWVERSPLVKRGDIVTMIVNAPGLKVSTKGRAEQTGYKGGSIRLTNLATQRIVSGRVTADGSVVVEF